MMRNTVLVLTNSADGAHSDSVIAKLEKRGLPVFRFDTDRIATGELSINLSAGDGFHLEFTCKDRTVAGQEIRSAWYRRPNHLKLTIEDPVQREYAEKEILCLLEGFWSNLCDVFWLNDPYFLSKARKKTWQLQLAREVGFRVPRTIVTNDPSKARQFIDECKKKVVFKAIYHEFLVYGERQYNIPTTLLTQEYIDRLELLRVTPAMFQEFIEKEYEVRVTIVGDKVFAVRINSQDNPLTVVDWRRPEVISSLSYEEVPLCDDVSHLCFCLLKRLGLRFGAYDFAVDKDGQYYFLEVNPNGQWYWLEDLVGVAVSDAIAELLVQAPLK